MRMDPSERRWTSPAWLVTGAVVVILAAVVATLLVTRSQDEAGPEPPPTTAPTQPTPSGSAPTAGETYESACGLRGGSLQQPTEQPSDLTWERVDGWAYPISPSAGPGRRDPDGPWSCYARTPTGAVLAAYTIDARLLNASKFEAVVQQQTVPGVGQSRLLSSGQPPSEAITESKGFLLESYDQNSAVVSFYLVSQGESFTCSSEVQWRSNDWQLVVLADGSTSSGCVASAPTRFVTWGEN